MPFNRFNDDEVLEKPFDRKIFGRILAYLKPFSKQIAIILSLVAVTSAIGLINPYLMKLSIDEFIAKSNIRGLIIMAAVLLSLNMVSMICQRFRISIMSKVAKTVLFNIRQDLFAHIQTLSLDFFDSRPVGKILARIIGDVNSLNDILINAITSLLPDSVMLIAIVIILLSMNARLAIIALIMLPALAFSLTLVQVVARKRWQLVRKRSSNVNAYIHESFAGSKVVKAFVREEESSHIFLDLARDMREVWLSAIRANNALWPIVDTSWGISMALVYWYGIRLLNTGSITIGMLVAFTGYLGMFWQPIINLSNFYNSLVSAMAGAERIFEIMDKQPDIKDKVDAIELPDIIGRIEFKNVTFSYGDDQPVLKDVSFEVEPGETIALVGPTGAGKTTVINLIARFYDANDGSILIDGHDIKDITLKSLRSRMGIMLQDSFLFPGTIADNIRYGKLDATMDEIIEAAKAANAHEFIVNMEKGYDTEVSERGSRLSMGQRQLISFARTILADPRILILDEATSSIDTHTEMLIQQALKRLLTGRTSFVIAHRLSTIRNADRIMVVNNGNIIEAGSHDELMKKRGHYYNLYMAQYKFLEEIS